MAALVSQATVAAVAAAAALTAASLGATPQEVAAAVAAAVHDCWRWTVPFVKLGREDTYCGASEPEREEAVEESPSGVAAPGAAAALCALVRRVARLEGLQDRDGLDVWLAEGKDREASAPLLDALLEVPKSRGEISQSAVIHLDALQDPCPNAATPRQIELVQGLLSAPALVRFGASRISPELFTAAKEEPTPQRLELAQGLLSDVDGYARCEALPLVPELLATSLASAAELAEVLDASELPRPPELRVPSIAAPCASPGSPQAIVRCEKAHWDLVDPHCDSVNSQAAELAGLVDAELAAAKAALTRSEDQAARRAALAVAVMSRDVAALKSAIQKARASGLPAEELSNADDVLFQEERRVAARLAQHEALAASTAALLRQAANTVTVKQAWNSAFLALQAEDARRRRVRAELDVLMHERAGHAG